MPADGNQLQCFADSDQVSASGNEVPATGDGVLGRWYLDGLPGGGNAMPAGNDGMRDQWPGSDGVPGE